MIDPVSRVQSYTPKVDQTSAKNTGAGSGIPFSMDQAVAEEAARDEGVFYERGGNASDLKNSDKKQSPDPEKEDFIEKPGPDAPLGAVNTAELLKGIRNFLSGIWNNLIRIFGNIWESKPLNDGAGTTGSKDASEEAADAENITDEIDFDGDPLHTEDSLNFHRGTSGSAAPDQVPGDAFDENISSLEEEMDEEMAGGIPEDHIKPYEDKAIKDALLSGDDERFQRIITRGGERKPAISSALLTQYDSRGRIISIDPSDENMILHGTDRTRRGYNKK